MRKQQETPLEEPHLAAWLEKGLGRAILFLQQTDPRLYRDVILRACTHNQTFDQQCEEGRDLFLHDVLMAANDMDYYRPQLFAALMDLNANEEYAPNQLFGLVRRMAQSGDLKARDCLYAAFDRQVATAQDFRGATEFVELDGLSGLLFITAHYLRCKQAGSVSDDDREWNWWLSELEERDGKDATQSALRQRADTIPGLRELLQYAEAERAKNERWREEWKKNPRPIMSYAELKALIYSKGRATYRGTLSTWGRHAAEVDLQQAAQDLIAETDADRVFAYTWIFSNRAFPLSTTPLEHSPLLTLAQSADVEQAWRAMRALGNLTHPAVRALGLQLIADSTRAGEGADLLENNFEEGDFALLETVLQQPLETTTYHSVGMSVRQIAEEHLSPRAVPSLLLLYVNGPCSLCRHFCVKLLLQLDALPASLRAECRYDADEHTRKLVSTPERLNDANPQETGKTTATT